MLATTSVALAFGLTPVLATSLDDRLDLEKSITSPGNTDFSTRNAAVEELLDNISKSLATTGSQQDIDDYNDLMTRINAAQKDFDDAKETLRIAQEQKSTLEAEKNGLDLTSIPAVVFEREEDKGQLERELSFLEAANAEIIKRKKVIDFCNQNAKPAARKKILIDEGFAADETAARAIMNQKDWLDTFLTEDQKTELATFAQKKADLEQEIVAAPGKAQAKEDNRASEEAALQARQNRSTEIDREIAALDITAKQTDVTNTERALNNLKTGEASAKQAHDAAQASKNTGVIDTARKAFNQDTKSFNKYYLEYVDAEEALDEPQEKLNISVEILHELSGLEKNDISSSLRQNTPDIIKNAITANLRSAAVPSASPVPDTVLDTATAALVSLLGLRESVIQGYLNGGNTTDLQNAITQKLQAVKEEGRQEARGTNTSPSPSPASTPETETKNETPVDESTPVTEPKNETPVASVQYDRYGNPIN